MKTARGLAPAGVGGRDPRGGSCDDCAHPVRVHGVAGCVLARCVCVLTLAELTAGRSMPDAAAAPVEPPSGPTLDLLDPVCGRCPHRRGRHVTGGSAASGSAAKCQRCTCTNFARPGGTDAPAAPPAEPTPLAPIPAPAPAAAPPTPAQPQRKPTQPRLAVARPVTAPAAVTFANAGEHVEATGGTTGLHALLTQALYVSARWYCPACHQWPLHAGPCPGCRRPLQPVYHVTIPRESA